MPPISYLFSNMLNEGKGTVYGGKKNGQKNDREEVKGRKKKGKRKNQHEEGEGRTSFKKRDRSVEWNSENCAARITEILWDYRSAIIIVKFLPLLDQVLESLEFCAENFNFVSLKYKAQEMHV